MDKGRDKKEGELLSLLVKGDMDAFDELYWKYQRAVFQNALRLTRNTSAAEDIVQEVFVSLWEKKESVNPDLPLAGWLFVSSYNRSVNILKKRLRESLVVDKLKNKDFGTETFTEISDLQFSILNEAVAMLPLQKRRVFELCKLQGKTYEEAASDMQISRHTVKEYLSDAMKFIRDYAAKHPVIYTFLTTWM